jgi:glycosyltransferase involved in cell wall biosynthesis
VSKLAFNLPLNSTSLGQVSLSILRELYNRKLDITLFPIGGADLSAQTQDQDFFNWIQKSINESQKSHSRKNPIFKLWHINGSLESYSDKQVLLTFYEVDTPTKTELNILKNNALTLLSSNYAVSTFKENGVDNIDYIPLGFDKNHFSVSNNNRKKDGIHFGLFGKLEPVRKRHLKTLQAWAKKFGNQSGYYLNCALFNPFMDPNMQSQIIAQALENKRYWNINFLGYMQSNSVYNDFLNNTDIVIAMSGGEGWGLPEFQSVAMGKHCVGLHAHAYKEWMNEDNSILVNPNGKIPCYDNFFFKQGMEFNQGNVFDWKEEDLIEGFDKAINRFQLNPINSKGLKLQTTFSYENMVSKILEIMNKI